jgi:hypothetical protein
VPVSGQMARRPAVLVALGPLPGFVGHGYFSLFGAMLAELFPTSARATGQGLTYNVGRALTSAFFLPGAALILTLPDTGGERLED